MGTKPVSIDKALNRPDANSWKQALEYEISQLQRLCTWDIVDKPNDKLVISCLAILKEKHDANDNIVTCHVRIITGGHNQTYGVDYTKTF
jgi:hypothetical protein